MYEQTLYKVVEPIKINTIKRLNKSKKWKYGYNKEHDMESVLRRLFNLGYKTKFLASSSERKSNIINQMNYKKSEPIQTDGVIRRIYEDINDDDAIELICHKGGARTIFLTSR